MSKLIFSTLSVLALLLAGTNCATGKRGGGEGGSYPACAVGSKLNPGDGCSGPNYTLSNKDGTLAWSGSYTKSCRSFSYLGGSARDSVRINSSSFIDSTGGHFICDDLLLARGGNAWTIESLPPPAATVH